MLYQKVHNSVIFMHHPSPVNGQRKFNIYTSQLGNLFLNSIIVCKNLNSNKILNLEQKQRL